MTSEDKNKCGAKKKKLVNVNIPWNYLQINF